jgi:hypothetical protein
VTGIASGSKSQIKLNFSRAISELVVVVKSSATQSADASDPNAFTTFDEAVSTIGLTFNNQYLQSYRDKEASFFLERLPKKSYSRNPFLAVYAIPIASLAPHADVKTGLLDFSQFQNVQLELTFNSGPFTGVVDVYALTHNVMHIDGTGTVHMSNA